jgi:cytochrome c oxidase subunit II
VSHSAVIITVAYSVAVILGSAISFAVFRSTLRPLEEDRTEKWSRRESAWLVIMIVVLFALLMGTIFYVPYGDSAGPNAQYVKVTGVQFAWAIEAPQTLVTGTPVEFRATSEDVAHSFGVYNPDDVLIFQAQVPPDHVQKIVHTFTQAGVYTVRCLEFCGAGHHLMKARFVVKPA